MTDKRKTWLLLNAESGSAHSTEGEVSEDGLEAPVAALERFFVASPMGVHQYQLEPDGRLVFVGANPAADRLLAVDNSQFLGKTIEEAFPPLSATEIPERYRRAAANGESWRTEQIAYEDEQIKGAFEVHAFQTLPQRMAALFLDITERKRAEHHLKSLTECLVGLGPQFEQNVERLAELCGRLLGGKAALYCGRQDGTMRVITGWQLPPSLTLEKSCDAPSCLALLFDGQKSLSANLPQASCLASTQSASQETGLCHRRAREVKKDGKALGVLSVWFADDRDLTADHERLLGTVAAAIAVEEQRRQAEEERRSLSTRIQHAQKLESLGVLAGGIAHDFNNLLAGVLGNASLALLELPPDSSVRPCVEDVERAAMRAADLVRQLLAYAGKENLVSETIELEALIVEMRHLLSVSISKKAELVLDFAPGVPPVHADVSQLRQLILNLITNASEAMENESGQIRIRTGVRYCQGSELSQLPIDDELEAGDYCFLEVSDTGCGMDDDTLAKVFEPFFSTKFPGRGLGLPATMGIVRGHRGAINLESEVGVGTTCRVYFPPAPLGTRQSPQPLPGAGGWRSSGLVLLVDDEEVARTAASRMLTRLGFDVISARNGQQAIELFDDYQEQVVCVLLDLTMPEMDGEQCFAELLRIDPEVKVLLSSGYDQAEMRARFADSSLADVIQKPYVAETLAAKLRQILEPP